MRRDRVSGHSGLRKSVELRQMAEKSKRTAEKREAQLSAIYAVLDHMLEVERIRMIAEVFRHYEIKQGDRA